MWSLLSPKGSLLTRATLEEPVCVLTATTYALKELSTGPPFTCLAEKAQYAVSVWIPHPGASVPPRRKNQLIVPVWKVLKLTTGVGFTTQVPPMSVDSYIWMVAVEKSSKNTCGTPWLSTTRSENC